MAKKISPVSVPEELFDDFNLARNELMEDAEYENYSELVRTIVFNGAVLDKYQLGEYLSRERLKTSDHKYIIVRL